MAATQPGKESQQASKQKAWQHLRSGLAIGAMTALCGGFLWMLYAPQEKTPGNEMFEGFDTSIPDATVSEMNADKRKVYEEILVPAGMGDVAIYTEMGRFLLWHFVLCPI